MIREVRQMRIGEMATITSAALREDVMDGLLFVRSGAHVQPVDTSLAGSIREKAEGRLRITRLAEDTWKINHRPDDIKLDRFNADECIRVTVSE